MNSTLFLQYVVAITVLIVTPGPDMLFCLACGLTGGPRAGFGAALGTATGQAIYVAASAGGLAVIVRAAPSMLTWMHAAGAVVLIALGVHTLRARGRPREQTPGPHTYLRGLVADLLNPKTALFSVAFLPRFVDPGAGDVGMQFAVLGAVFVALEIAVDGTVGVQARRAARLLPNRRALDTAAGTVLLGLGVALAASCVTQLGPVDTTALTQTLSFGRDQAADLLGTSSYGLVELRCWSAQWGMCGMVPDEWRQGVEKHRPVIAFSAARR